MEKFIKTFNRKFKKLSIASPSLNEEMKEALINKFIDMDGQFVTEMLEIDFNGDFDDHFIKPFFELCPKVKL